ncbi:Serine/threonine-protein kinase Pkn1 [Rubripirellula obstinata]|uniref:Serine/threonine-protein kinase Pkn1 n=1 Tax=Rubripirellula obstinata TaxID=406547 RepID=A0A5B1CPT8_9BACT|nr:serine/threonine-protein kinase [Rubripirellula obstinata]KAA1262251.1 Serine/threonine-protein kinase Pkn1 [Rubripirellula obstinata]
MTLSGLSATELARIDSVCLDFESQLRRGEEPSIDEIVDYHGGENADLLRQELGTIRQELLVGLGKRLTPSQDSQTTIAPFGTGPPPASKQSLHQLPIPGTRLGPYQIERQIGQGGMGVVFSAHDHRLGRKVAIKVLSTNMAGRSDLVERFDREARAVAAISHPHIVELFDVGNFQGLPYAVMEFLDGITFEDFLNDESLTPTQVRRFGCQIADALTTAHAAGVIHRDLKPQNIMLVGGDPTRDSSISDSRISSVDHAITKLFDFGLSRVELLVASMDAGDELDGTRTSEGMIMGTPGYMAPEQASGEAVTASADLFSLGCILYEAFYGERAFEGKTKSQRIAAAISDSPGGDANKRTEDPELAKLIDDCLQKRPEDRPENAAVIADRLRMGLAGGDGARPVISRRGWMGLAATGTALALGGGAVGTWFSMKSRATLHAINSLAVLSFEDETGFPKLDTSPGKSDELQPLGQSTLSPGEALPGLLVHELTRVSDLMVPSFRPATASSPAEYRELGALMEVDALLTGTVRPINSGSQSAPMWDLDLQLISSKTGTQIWGNRLQTVAGEHRLAQTQAASKIAAVIGRQLTASADGSSAPNEQAFHCLVDGKLRSDPDSADGLARALMCFEKAHEFDASFVDPIAGIALTSITLAAQSPPDQAIELAERARKRASEALQLDKMSIDARLAKLMVDWQMLGRYKKIDAGFQELIMKSPDRWQIHHQYALFLLASGRTEVAIAELREASLLSPLSISIRIDLARAYWFAGDHDRAITDAIRIRSRPGGQKLADGLLIDIYEQDGDFQKAAELDPMIAAESSTLDAAGYWMKRKDLLDSMPYAAFGEKVSQLIWYSRARELNDKALAYFLEPRTPMLPLALAAHPSLTKARMMKRVTELLPSRGMT